ncbi:Non-specific lipid-transfer protein 1 [Dendrobium catenatum]|uniref:Non-specific lipid-transfer protein 1 n=1 Tax=Dendrobium catenatum TaxID=906689 RepID=A0A2I0WAE1_9ASPA|nr:Non-specific lipid-transfer protein 1 [Dendrobium catenatum]
MCVPYLIGWDRSLFPQCCMAVRSVKELSRTPTAQESICKCLERMVVKIGRIDQHRATGLAIRCRVHGSIIPTGNRFSCRT